MSQPRARQQGQSLTEFALVMPILIALVVAIMLIALTGFSWVSISSAARLGVRHMLTYPTRAEDPVRFPNVDDEIRDVVCQGMPFLDCTRATVTILPQPPEDRAPLSENDLMTIHITYPMNLPTVRLPYVIRPGSFYLLPPIVLNAEARMRLID